MTHRDTCKLRYCRPAGTDWHVERIARSAAAFRKQVLQGMGWIVVIIGGDGSTDDPSFETGITRH